MAKDKPGQPDETRRKAMQHKARGQRPSPSEEEAPEYYAKDRMPGVARPGPGSNGGLKPDDDE